MVFNTGYSTAKVIGSSDDFVRKLDMINRQHRNNLADDVADTLTQAIRSGTYRPGERLPSVEKLAREWGIGRSTVREALRLLQARGLVEVIHGSGTFIVHERIARSSVPVPAPLLSFTELVRERGMRPTSIILHKEVVTADDELVRVLRLQAGDKVNLLRRLRLADDAPVSLETSVCSAARFPDLLDQPWTPHTSLYALLREKYGVTLHHAQHIVRAVAVGRTESQLLQIKPRSPVLLVEILALDADGTPIEFGRSFYSSTRFEYRVELNLGGT
jgi:GntR family transcriptional regulator